MNIPSKFNKYLVSESIDDQAPFMKDVVVNRHPKHDDKFSITQLTSGCRSYWYNMRKEYPRTWSQFFDSYFGTCVHRDIIRTARDPKNNGRYICEEDIGVSFDVDGVTVFGEPDLYDTETCVLWDIKTAGQYSQLTKFMGLGDKDALFEYEIQLNFYRMCLEKSGKRVRKMMWQVCPNWANCKSDYVGVLPSVPDIKMINEARRVHARAMTFECRFIDDAELVRWLSSSVAEFKKHMKTENVPPPCKHTWGGMRCRRFCSVHDCDKNEAFKNIN